MLLRLSLQETASYAAAMALLGRAGADARELVGGLACGSEAEGARSGA